jgi:hypothetical protein
MILGQTLKLPLKKAFLGLLWRLRLQLRFAIDFPSLMDYILEHESNQFKGYQYFVDRNLAEKWGNTHFGKRLTELNDANVEYQKKLSSFSVEPTTFAAFARFTGNQHQQINEYLKSNRNPPTPSYDKLISLIENEIKLNRCPDDIIVIRWISNVKFDSMYSKKPGNYTLYEKGFASTATYLTYDHGTDYGLRDIRYEKVLLIKIKKGSNCLFIGNTFGRSHEMELTLPANSVFRIEKILFDKIFFCKLQ